MIRIIGTNAFFFSLILSLGFCFFFGFFKQTCIFYCLTCNNKKKKANILMTQRAEGIRVVERMDMPNLIKLCGAGGRGRDGLFTDKSKSCRTFLNVLLLCIRSKLRQALTLLFSVFVIEILQSKNLFKQMRTRLIKMKVLASNFVPCGRSCCCCVAMLWWMWVCEVIETEQVQRSNGIGRPVSCSRGHATASQRVHLSHSHYYPQTNPIKHPRHRTV